MDNARSRGQDHWSLWPVYLLFCKSARSPYCSDAQSRRTSHVLRVHYSIYIYNTVQYGSSSTFARASIETRSRFCQLLTIDTYAMDSVGCGAVLCAGRAEDAAGAVAVPVRAARRLPADHGAPGRAHRERARGRTRRARQADPAAAAATTTVTAAAAAVACARTCAPAAPHSQGVHFILMFSISKSRCQISPLRLS